MRVDVVSPVTELSDCDVVRATVTASHLFGPPAEGMSARWSLVREHGAGYPERWEAFEFEPAGASSRGGTVAAGELALSTLPAALASRRPWR